MYNETMRAVRTFPCLATTAVRRGRNITMVLAEHILNALTQPTLVLDQSFRVVKANPAFFEALPGIPAEVNDTRIEDFLPVDYGQPAWEHVLQHILANNGQAHKVEIACTVAAATRRIFSIVGRRVLQEQPEATLILLEFRDIAIERQLLAESNSYEQHGLDLEGINRELEAFTHSVSHDLRTPLRLMSKVAYLLLKEHGTQLPEGATDKIHMILDSTEEMGKLIETLLSFSQVNRVTLKRRRVDLEGLIHDVLEDLEVDHEGRNISVTVDPIPACMADRELVRQVLSNLLANALKFTRKRERAVIHIGSQESNGATTYFVRDNGVGFEMNHSRAMFLAFHRLGNARHVEGSGIGLALVRRIVERHGGLIWAESTPGEGATFYFTLGSH